VLKCSGADPGNCPEVYLILAEKVFLKWHVFGTKVDLISLVGVTPLGIALQDT
jgi:hypothetical protein